MRERMAFSATAEPMLMSDSRLVTRREMRTALSGIYLSTHQSCDISNCDVVPETLYDRKKTYVPARRDMSNPSVSRNTLVARKAPKLARCRRHFCNGAGDERKDDDQCHDACAGVRVGRIVEDLDEGIAWSNSVSGFTNAKSINIPVALARISSTSPSVKHSVTAMMNPRTALKVNDQSSAFGSVALESLTSSATWKCQPISTSLRNGSNGSIPMWTAQSKPIVEITGLNSPTMVAVP